MSVPWWVIRNRKRKKRRQQQLENASSVASCEDLDDGSGRTFADIIREMDEELAKLDQDFEKYEVHKNEV